HVVDIIPDSDLRIHNQAFMEGGRVVADGSFVRQNAGPADRLSRYDKLFIVGEWFAPEDGGLLESIDPSTGEPWAVVAYGGRKDVDRAVAAARAAFEGPWGRMPGHERAALMRRFADLYQKHAAELAVVESRDNGR